jgi:hypothetical protein
MKRIDKRKEELYDLMTEAHHKYGYGTGRDEKLFKRLSGDIEPRPSVATHVEVESNGNKDRREVEGLWYRVLRPWVDVVAMEDLASIPWMPSRSGFL